MFFRRAFLIITEECDSRCALCDYWLIKQPKRLSPKALEGVVLPALLAAKIELACVSGGEPTTHPELPLIISLLKKAGLLVTLTTSTSLLDTHFDAIRGDVDHYMISVDGHNAPTYRRSRGVDLFQKVVDSIQRIKSETSAHIAISCVLQGSNVERVCAIYELACSLGVDQLYFRVPDLKPHVFGRAGEARPASGHQCLITEQQFSRLEAGIMSVIQRDKDRSILGQSAPDLMRKLAFFRAVMDGNLQTEGDCYCDVPLTSFVVDPSLTVRPCFYLPHSQPLDSEPIEEGNAFRAVFGQMISSPEFRKTWCAACQQFDGHKVEVTAVYTT